MYFKYMNRCFDCKCFEFNRATPVTKVKQCTGTLLILDISG